MERRLNFVPAVLLAVALILTGCSAIPSSGQAQKIDELSDNPFDSDISMVPRGPQPDATPRQIVEDFINAGTGTADNYLTAREFLGPGLEESWRPDVRTLVYESLPNVVEGSAEGTYFVNLDLVRVIDEDGISRPVPAGGGDIVEFEVTQQPNGQWRITEVPDGIMLHERNFYELFNAHSLYFYDPEYQHAVPDIRWFARRSSVSASLMRVLLEGPAPYLQGAVVSAFVDGTALVNPTVAIESGEAVVELSMGSTQTVSSLQLQRMQRQAELVLIGGLNTISSVELIINDVPLDIPEGIEPPTPIQNKQVPAAQVVIEDDELRLFEGRQSSAIPQVPSIAEHSPQDPAMSVAERAVPVSDRRYAFLNGPRNELLTVAPGDDAATVVSGDGLTEPSFDIQDWLWTAEGTGQGPGSVYAVQTTAGEPNVVNVAAQWLLGRTVTDLQISRDGTRALVVTHSNGESNVMIAGITRSAEGVPTELTEPLNLAHSVPADQGAWVDDTSVVVMKASAEDDVQAEILNFDGRPERITGLTGMMHLSAGNGTQQIYASTAEGLFLRVGNGWTSQSETVRDPSFAG